MKKMYRGVAVGLILGSMMIGSSNTFTQEGGGINFDFDIINNAIDDDTDIQILSSERH